MSTVSETLPTFPLPGPISASGSIVRFCAGPYNGLTAKIVKACETHCSVELEFEHRFYEVVTPLAWLRPLAAA